MTLDNFSVSLVLQFFKVPIRTHFDKILVTTVILVVVAVVMVADGDDCEVVGVMGMVRMVVMVMVQQYCAIC